MTYQKQFRALLIIIAVLAGAFTLSLVFDPERSSSRSAAYTWLDSAQNSKISKISITGQGEDTALERVDGRWLVAHNGMYYPAKQMRVEDFLAALSKKAPYPVRSGSASAHERLGLTEAAAMRVTVLSGTGQPLLDLLVGASDSTSREVYLRKAGQDEARSGENKFSAWLSGPVTAWYNLRLFNDAAGNALDIKNVQRLTAVSNGTSAVFSRWNREWTISGITVAAPDMDKIESYINAVLAAEADNFEDSGAAAGSFTDSITLELGDGSVKTIRLGTAAEDGRRPAIAAEKPELVYSLASWAAGRLFKTAADFEK